MRKILFRGKSTDRVAKGKWVYGDLSACIYNPEHDPLGCQSRIETDIHTHYTDKPWSGSIYTVDPDTVGQYTGLTDKNGKKIFEGDILCNEKGICYGDCYAAVVKYNCGEFRAEGFVNFYAVDFCVLEVIGNIYDNPELMEASE